ncbi:MAG: hypothetical protein V4489_01000 [Chlamydiota bacterium]
MQIMLGSTKGDRKAPKYAEWAQKDPRWDTNQKRFIAPLESLEMIRQPGFSGATLIKSGAFSNNHINSDWRYGKAHACVEDRNQGNNTPKKIAGAGLNLTELLQRFPYMDSRRSIAKVALYENYTNNGYRDDAEISVTPSQLFNATNKSIFRRDDTDLDDLVTKLFMTQIGPQTTPSVQHQIVNTLF